VHFPCVDSRFWTFGLFLSWDVFIWIKEFHQKLSDLICSFLRRIRMFGFLTLKMVLSGSVSLEKIFALIPDE
jgi:hypothetical protein